MQLLLERAVGRYGARRSSYEESEYWLAEWDHQQRCRGLHKALAQHLAHTPQAIREDGGNSADAIRDQMQWQDDYDELQLSLIREDCCHHLALDSPFGEQLDPPELDHWRDAPGVDADNRELTFDELD